MNDRAIEIFIDIIFNKGWTVKNKNSDLLFYNYDFVIEWELNNELLDKKTKLYFL